MRLKRLILASSAAFFAGAGTAFAAKPTEGGWWLQEFRVLDYYGDYALRYGLDGLHHVPVLGET